MNKIENYDFFELGVKYGERVETQEPQTVTERIASEVIRIKKIHGEQAAQEFELGACSAIQYVDMFLGEMPIIDESIEISKILTDPNERNTSYFGGDFKEIENKYDSEGNFIEPKIR